ncbi:MAG: hypothetical protein K8R59_16845 [Thermoanaerobaculales bacterium]|nr:hypothetical protein [Thermoanaerobaculales bacterium]
MKRRFERGDVPVGCLVGLVVLGIVALVAIKAGPVMVSVGELDSTISVLADRANRIDYNDKRIMRDILDKAQELDIPVTKKDVKIVRTRSRIKVTVKYTKEIDFGVYTYVWHKEHYEDRPLF